MMRCVSCRGGALGLHAGEWSGPARLAMIQFRPKRALARLRMQLTHGAVAVDGVLVRLIHMPL
jgi:hypothetical protein